MFISRLCFVGPIVILVILESLLIRKLLFAFTGLFRMVYIGNIFLQGGLLDEPFCKDISFITAFRAGTYTTSSDTVF
jgi:hypothetical protein